MGGRVHGPISQRDFLMRLGIESRAANLKAQAPPEKSTAIERGLKRLTATGAKGMGELFKVLAIADPKLGELPGFVA
jgi:NADH dehydrogenase [ubiquinone] 1 alpha subcomplex assembly factor 7